MNERRVAVAELEVALGFGITEAQALAGLACAAGDLREVVLAAGVVLGDTLARPFTTALQANERRRIGRR